MSEATVLIQIPAGGALERQLRGDPPHGVFSGAAVVEVGATDAEGNLEAIDVGEVVLSVGSPEALSREADEVRRVIADAGTGVEPLVLVVEAAEELREDGFAPVLAAADHTERPVIVRVMRPA